jgi:hypothetical protein
LVETLAKHILQTDFDLSIFPSTSGKPKYFQTADLKEAGGSINLGLSCSSTATCKFPPFPKVCPVNVFLRLRRENVYECHWNLSILFTRYSVNHWQQKWIIIRCLLTINKIWNLPGIWNQSDLHPSSSSTGCIYCWHHRKLGQAHCFSR